ncbi:hypothetical protein ACOSP7_003292 [Xanthoceras sorbifolium]
MLDSRVQSLEKKSSEKMIISEADKNILSKHEEEMSDCLERLKAMKEELNNKDRSLKIVKDKELSYLEELKRAKESIKGSTLRALKTTPSPSKTTFVKGISSRVQHAQGVISNTLKKKASTRQPQAQGKGMHSRRLPPPQTKRSPKGEEIKRSKQSEGVQRKSPLRQILLINQP